MRVGGALRCAAPGSEPETARRLLGRGEVLGFSFTGQIERCMSSVMFSPALLRSRVPFVTVENLVSAGSLSCNTQSVGIYALVLQMLAKCFVHKSCKERTCPAWAASVKLVKQ